MNSWQNSWTKLELRTRLISHRINVWYMLPINLQWKSTKCTVSKYTVLWLLADSQHAKLVSSRSGLLKSVDAVCRKSIEFCRLDSWMKSEDDEQVKQKSHPVASIGWKVRWIINAYLLNGDMMMRFPITHNHYTAWSTDYSLFTHNH